MKTEIFFGLFIVFGILMFINIPGTDCKTGNDLKEINGYLMCFSEEKQEYVKEFEFSIWFKIYMSLMFIFLILFIFYK